MNLEALLVAISLLESAGNDEAVERNKSGKVISRSRYQLSKQNWEHYTRTPWFPYANDPVVSTRIATAHLRWIIFALERKSVPVCPRTVSAAWQLGPERFVKLRHAHRIPSEVIERGIRLERVYKRTVKERFSPAVATPADKPRHAKRNGRREKAQ